MNEEYTAWYHILNLLEILPMAGLFYLFYCCDNCNAISTVSFHVNFMTNMVYFLKYVFVEGSVICDIKRVKPTCKHHVIPGCVQFAAAHRETRSECPCPTQCNLTSFRTTPSVASLSSFGVSELLNRNNERVEKRLVEFESCHRICIYTMVSIIVKPWE